MVQALLLKGADPRLKTNNGNHCVHYTAMHGNVEVLQCLIQAAPDLASISNNNGDTPFSFAAARWQLPAMEYLMLVGNSGGVPGGCGGGELIDGKETCATCNKEGLTSLHAAAGFVMPKKDQSMVRKRRIKNWVSL
jgi:ankyrin repeat protein